MGDPYFYNPYGWGYPSGFGPSRPVGGYTNVYQYEVITPALTTPISLAELKNYAKVDNDDDDLLLTAIISAVTAFCEKYTGRTLITTEYRTYRNNFCFRYTKLRRSPLQSISVIKYYKEGSLVTVDSSLYNIIKDSWYSRLYLAYGQDWPSDADIMPQAVQIDFKVGYGDDSDSIPADLKIALLQHALSMYNNRGDCDSDGCGSALPSQAKIIYGIYKISDMSPKEFAGGDE